MVNYKDEVLDRKEKYLKNTYKTIKFKDDIIVKDLKDLLNKFFIEKNTTYYLDGTVQCEESKYTSYTKRRSYYDGYLVAIHYFPNITYKEFYNTLKLYDENRPYYNKLFSFCSTVGRNVWQNNLKEFD